MHDARVAFTIAVLCCAGAAAAEPDDATVTNVVFEPVSVSACDDALAMVAPEIKSPAKCVTIAQLRVAGVGDVRLDRLSVPANDPLGFSLVLSLARAGETRWMPLTVLSAGCATTKCISNRFKSARLVRLTGQDPSFGVEIDVNAVLEPTQGLGKPSDHRMYIRLACATRAGVIDCKQVTIGGVWSSCRVAGWRGTTVNYACDRDVELAPPRSADIDGIPEADLERVLAMYSSFQIAIFDHRDNCAATASEIGRVLTQDPDGFILARKLLAAHATLAKRLRSTFNDAMYALARAGTCVDDTLVQNAVGRASNAFGISQ